MMFIRRSLAAVALLALSTVPALANPNALWHIVHDECEVSGQAPCLKVNTAEHYALLKDRRGIAQYLLIPTERISGIESPILRDPATPNFLADAWAERTAVNALLPHPIPRDGMSLVVNAQTARSQNQLHIHIDCLSAKARDILKADAAKISHHWAPLPNPIAGHHFTAIRVDGKTLGSFNPFLALAKTLGNPTKDMGDHDLVVVGANFPEGPGFIVLADKAIPGHGGEDVEDHTCKIAD